MSVIVDTETIPSGALYDFIGRYLLEIEKDGEGKLPSKDRIHYAAGDLERLLNETPCTPLLATMWAKEIGAPPQPEAFRPRGVASLIESYLRRILLPAANGNETLVDRLTKDASRIAERELGWRYLPGYITRATALEIIRTLDPSDPDKRFGLLERSRLLESTSQHSDTVHIAPDPWRSISSRACGQTIWAATSRRGEVSLHNSAIRVGQRASRQRLLHAWKMKCTGHQFPA
jgi:hypothetical protein